MIIKDKLKKKIGAKNLKNQLKNDNFISNGKRKNIFVIVK